MRSGCTGMVTVLWCAVMALAPVAAAEPPGRQGGGDTCAEATIIPELPYADQGTTSGFGNDYDFACPYSSNSPDVVYAYTPAADITINVTLCVDVTNYDTKLFVYAGDCLGTPIACNEDSCASPYYGAYVSSLSGVKLTAGTPHFIVIDGYGGAAGDYRLDVTEAPPPPTCPPDGTLYGQPPHEPAQEWMAYTSDTAPAMKVFDNYSVSADICQVHWWGLDLYFQDGWVECDLPNPTPFRIEFYADSGGKPAGSPVATYSVSAAVSPVTTYDGYLLKAFQAPLVPCATLHAGWIAIQGDLPEGTCWFQWISSGVGDEQAYLDNGISLIPISNDLAFCLVSTGADPCAGYVLGDANGDGVVNAFDIDPFVLALTDPEAYQGKYGGEKALVCQTDINQDGKVDAFDIDPFVDLLTGG